MAADMAKSKEKKKGAKPARAKADDRIMGTNDSSIVSKRSVARLYHPGEPDFYEPVTRKFQRRHPLINRGYWLRMQAVEQVVCQFLQSNPERPKAVVNLGCGYDPLPFQFWNRHPSQCEKTTFVDVDYPDLIERKKAFILNSELFRGYLPDLETHQVQGGVLFSHGNKYAAVGVDLRRLDVLSKLLDISTVKGSEILFVAEVSITYMGVDDSDSLIKWAGTFPNAQFCLLEQYLPDGPDHPFAATMLAHFKKLNTLIYAVAKYPLLQDQRDRFRTAGWSDVHARSLWDLWSDLDSISSEQRKALDAVEPFDEWEEFALFAGHYFVLVAYNKDTESVNKEREVNSSQVKERMLPVHRNSIDNPTVGQAKTFRLLENTHTVKNAHAIDPDCLADGIRRFGAVFRDDSDIIYDGGFGIHSRHASLDIWAKTASGDWTLSLSKRDEMKYRMCHTITQHSDDSILIVGGRASPSDSYDDCHFYDSRWSPQERLSPGRFRHCGVAVDLHHGESKVIRGTLIMGGKTAAGEVLGDWKFWDKENGWRDVLRKTGTPSERFGAAMASLSPFAASGILLGGMTANGCVLPDIWRWQLEHIDGKISVFCEECSGDIKPKSAIGHLWRFGGSLVQQGQHLVLLGGISKDGVLPFSSEVVHLEIHTDSIEVRSVELELDITQRPLFVGIGAAPTVDGHVFICGGGAICFSFGGFHNSNSFSLFGDTKTELTQVGSGSPNIVPTLPKIQRMRISTREEFDEIVSASKPVVMEGFNLGNCVTRWSPEYLIDRIGADKDIVVHSCPTERMTFQEKNFSYVKQPFGEFMHAIGRGERLYLRAVASTQPFKQPTKLDQDFPGLADDFAIPDALGRVRENMHSSPLRVSGPITLWLHYDVLANVLCQIRGTKTLRLYPPSDVGRLGFTAGSSSSNLDVFGANPTSPEDTHPFDAEMRPGDVLYIPPMWMHGAKPTGGVSVAVNVFFRNLETGYAIGRDVYGNRDLQAYEQGRRDVEKMVRSFDGIPSDIKGFYLQRLAAELGSHAHGN